MIDDEKRGANYCNFHSHEFERAGSELSARVLGASSRGCGTTKGFHYSTLLLT